jgi:hypothetical protein
LCKPPAAHSQNCQASRSNPLALKRRNGGHGCSLQQCNGIKEQASVNDDKKQAPPPPPTQSGAPDKELEQELKKHPHDLDKKVDVGSDESMDASDPPAATQPGQHDEPVPSSTFPE